MKGFMPDAFGTDWLCRRAVLSGNASTPSEVSIAYIDCKADPKTLHLGTILLIHGYPETSHQFRYVIGPLVAAGYHVIAPDYRGAGQSSRPRVGYEKVQMATDLHDLITKHLKITDKIHVVGHDIGGMVAYAYATRFSKDTATVVWGECPIPGTRAYDRVVKDLAYGGLWHFIFHWQSDLPELLTAGKEREYIKSFYDRLIFNTQGITTADVDFYAAAFSQHGAMRAGFDVYRAFHQDADDTRKWLKIHGKCPVPSLTLNGDNSFLANIAIEQNEELFKTTDNTQISGSGHWCAEENPEDFVQKLLSWIVSNSE